MNEKLIDATASIVSSYVAQNPVEAQRLPELIMQIAQSLSKVGLIGASTFETASADFSLHSGAIGSDVRLEGRPAYAPAIPIEDSVSDDYIICLEDGKKLKMLKRHLKSFYNMSPDDYRRKWGLAKNYPMVCRNYANLRSRLAKEGGLGVGIQPKTAVAN